MSEHYKEILNKLKSKYQIKKFYGQTVYKLSRDGYVYLRFSSGAKRQKYFFGIEKEVIDRFGECPYCILFACGRHDNVILIPDYLLKSVVQDLKLAGGQYKINIFFRENSIDLKVTGKESVDVTKYYNDFDYIFTKPVYEKVESSVKEKGEPQGAIKKEKELKEELDEIIKNELIITSKNSKEPKLFESSIIKFLKYFGFTVEHVSGAGDTDIFVKEPFRTIIDAKSTSKRSLTRVNFSRLKQHKQKHNADYIAVVSNGFDPAVERDAEIEHATLFTVKTLCDILDIDRNYPLTPEDFHYLFKIYGEINPSYLDRLHKHSEEYKKYLSNINILINIIDKIPRNISEIYGRYELKCEQLLTEKLDKETVEQTTKFLSLPVLNILETDGKNNYYRKLSIPNSARKLSYIADLISKNKLKAL